MATLYTGATDLATDHRLYTHDGETATTTATLIYAPLKKMAGLTIDDSGDIIFCHNLDEEIVRYVGLTGTIDAGPIASPGPERPNSVEWLGDGRMVTTNGTASGADPYVWVHDGFSTTILSMFEENGLGNLAGLGWTGEHLIVHDNHGQNARMYFGTSSTVLGEVDHGQSNAFGASWHEGNMWICGDSSLVNKYSGFSSTILSGIEPDYASGYADAGGVTSDANPISDSSTPIPKSRRIAATTRRRRR